MTKDKLKDWLRPLKNWFDVLRSAAYDRRVFLRGYAPNVIGASIEQLSSHLLLHAHAIEKAVTRSRFEEGRGALVLTKMRRALDAYAAADYDREAFAFRYACSSIASLRDAYRRHGFKDDFLRARLGDWVDVPGVANELAGARTVTADRYNATDAAAFQRLIEQRVSVREYATTPVDEEALWAAIRLAQRAPSACNRQPGKVYVMTDRERIAEVLRIQTGFRGYDYPPALLLVTADNGRYVSSIEHNQGFVDGGLFAMTLLLGLEAQGLATCPLNAMFTVPSEKKLRRVMRIGAGEHLIMFIAVGNPKSEVSVAISSRYPVEEMTERR